MINNELLPTKAKTAEQRRLELSDPKYTAKYKPKIRSIYGYDIQPLIEPTGLGDIRPIRFFPDGLEVVVSGKNPTNYALLVLEEKKQIVDFYYDLKESKD